MQTKVKKMTEVSILKDVHSNEIVRSQQESLI
jgi:hypothetical protein